MGTSKSLSIFTLFLALAATPQAAVALRLAPLMTQTATVEPVFSLPESVADGTEIKIGSSSTLAGVNEVLEQRFENQYSGTKVEIDYTSSDEALAALDKGDIDLAAIGRPLTDAEKAQGYTSVELGRHKIAIIVSEENAYAGDVTTPQFGQIFRGEITDWSEFEGGTPGAIRFVDRPNSSDTRQAFSNYPVFKEAPFEVGTTASPVDEDSTEAVVSALGSDGIGFAIADQVKDMAGVRILSMHKVLPTNPAYPFSQPLSYVYKGEASPAVQAFLGYATAPDTAGILEDAKALGAKATIGGLKGAPDLDLSGLVGDVSLPDVDVPDVDVPDVDVPDLPTIEGADGDAGAVVPAPKGKFPWWWLLLGLPILGGLLWLLGRKGDDDREEVPPIAGVDPKTVAGAGAAVAGAGLATAAVGAVAAKTGDNNMVLVPRDTESAYAYWEVSDDSLSQLKKSGGEEFGLRLYDVTSRGPKAELPKPIHQESFDESECDRNLSIPTPNRDYVTEVGYKTASNQWLPAARSASVRVAPDMPSFSSLKAPKADLGNPVDGLKSGLSGGLGGVKNMATSAVDGVSTTAKTATDGIGGGIAGTGNLVKGAALAGTAAVGAGVAGMANKVGQVKDVNVGGKATTPDQLVLVPRDGQEAYAYWEISDEKKAALKQQGGEKLALRVYDVTGIDPRTQKPHGVQQFDCNENDNDLHVTVPEADRTYLADLGYTTADGKWLRLAHAAPVQVPAPDNGGSPSGPSNSGGAGLNVGGMMGGLKAKANNAVQSGKDAVGSGQSAIGNMGSSVLNTGTKAGQSVMDGTANAGQTVAKTGFSLGKGATNTLKTAVAGTAAAGVAAVATTKGAAQSVVSQGKAAVQPVSVVMVPRSSEAAYVYWELADGVEVELQQKQVETLTLRIHEVTNIELAQSPANSTQIFECKVTDRDRHVPVPVANKDYLAELGYTQANGSWVELARSLHVRVA